MSSSILDVHGKPMRRESPANLCPGCGARAKEHEEITSFGGHSTTVCLKCGYETPSTPFNPPREVSV